MNKSFFRARVVIVTCLTISGCGDEPNYRRSLLEQFSEDFAKAVGESGLKNAARFVSGHSASTHATSTGLQTEKLARTTYNILNTLLPKKAHRMDSQVGFLEYPSVNMRKAISLVGGPLGEYLSKLCKHQENSLPTVVVRETNKESEMKPRVTIVVYCEDDLEFFVTPSHMSTMQWQCHSNDTLTPILASMIMELSQGENQLPCKMHVQDGYGDQFIAAEDEEEKELIPQWIVGSYNPITTRVTLRSRENEKDNGSLKFTVRSDNIFQTLRAHQASKRKTTQKKTMFSKQFAISDSASSRQTHLEKEILYRDGKTVTDNNKIAELKEENKKLQTYRAVMVSVKNIGKTIAKEVKNAYKNKFFFKLEKERTSLEQVAAILQSYTPEKHNLSVLIHKIEAAQDNIFKASKGFTRYRGTKKKLAKSLENHIDELKGLSLLLKP
ncbi:MAG: hypothetical protein AAF320_00875 [Myxococcota bacterium]